ncbi:MAG TPA: YqzL family protein [Firmicutes bacterium]|nr:YqzL family protein [Bacillota bacterium]
MAVLWKLFEITGSISVYLLYRELCAESSKQGSAASERILRWIEDFTKQQM